MIGDGDEMGVAGQVENMIGAEGWLGVDDPVLLGDLAELDIEAGQVSFRTRITETTVNKGR